MTKTRLCSSARLTVAAAVVVLLCGALSLPGRAQTSSPLTLVSTVWPPFTNDPGQPRFALDLVEAGLKRIGHTARTTIVRPAEFTAALTAGPFDGSAAVWKDAERERTLIFSKPYLENRLVLIGGAGADVSANTIGDLKGKRLAIVEGYSYGESAESSGAIFVRVPSEEASLDALLKGAVDYTLMDELVVQYLLSNYPTQAAAKLKIGSTLVKRELYLAIRRTRPDAESLIANFNAQLRGMIADRTYHRLLHVDWIEADINGDSVPEYVPADDRAGPTAPVRMYTLFSPPSPSVAAAAKPGSDAPVTPGFYVGGNIYSDWASVPQNYKVTNNRPPDARRSTASIFNFKW